MAREALTIERLRALPPGEAAAWFVALRTETLQPGEQQQFEQWLAEDERNRRAFEAADRAWNSFSDAEDDELLSAMRRHARAVRRGPRPNRGWMAAAAAAVVVFGAAGAFVLPALKQRLSVPQPRTPAAPLAITYTSARGEVKELKLPDGSLMALDADSTVVGRFGANSRTVQLVRGRALFTVSHDPSRPFTVTAADRRVVDVGTRFDVNLTAGELVVTVLEGRVSIAPLAPGAVPIALNPGQQLVERLGQDKVRTIGDESQTVTAWRAGVISFDDQSLAEAAGVMNRYAGDRIVVRDPAIAALRVSGQFRAGQTERFAQTLTELYHLRTVRRADEVELISGR